MVAAEALPRATMTPAVEHTRPLRCAPARNGRTIPGLENAEFARLGGIHRNSFIKSPELLDTELRLKAQPNIRFAGQITGCEGYVESAAVGLLAARFSAAEVKGAALAPPPPRLITVGRQPSGYDARLLWNASPSAVGYRIVWREAWLPEWQHEVSVGTVTEYVLRRTIIDDSVFGVAAVGPDGHESTISAYTSGPARY